MRVPFISTTQNLEKRKGGGGKGGGGGSKGGGSTGKTGGGSSSSSGGTSKGSSSDTGASSSPRGASSGQTVPVSSLPAGKSSASTSSRGGGTPVTIASGQPFAGRTAGGGTRDQVYGTNTYGSGYPGVAQRGVAGAGFPFYFWPVVWGGAAGGSAAYLHDRNEYGDPDNSTRPGGPMVQAAFVSNTTNTTYHLLADNATTVTLISTIRSACASQDLNNASSSSAPSAYNASTASDPQPEQAIQYYRASSVVLTLDGYNDTSALGNDSSAPATPLPSGIDTTLLACLNSTIGDNVPLVDAGAYWGPPSAGTFGLVWFAIAVARMAF
ncbi:hypothetical protein OF83DRAFT_185343 [Amylostereum chailletii]|nr:hypothetical protein OF83DRAFT_185343 [Amylostereum chailletii]